MPAAASRAGVPSAVLGWPVARWCPALSGNRPHAHSSPQTPRTCSETAAPRPLAASAAPRSGSRSLRARSARGAAAWHPRASASPRPVRQVGDPAIHEGRSMACGWVIRPQSYHLLSTYSVPDTVLDLVLGRSSGCVSRDCRTRGVSGRSTAAGWQSTSAQEGRRKGAGTHWRGRF